MPPVRANYNSDTCVPISTNCVDWESGILDGIDLCSTDTIGTVAIKINSLVQSLKQQLDLSSFEYGCLASACEECPDPDKSLLAILLAIKNKVCAIEDLVGTPGSSYQEPTMILASCIQYINDQDVLVTQLPLSQYVNKIGTKLCQLNTIVNNHTQDIDNLDDRVTILENQEAPTLSLPTVTPTCVLPNTATAMNVVLSKLEKDFCTLKGATGEPTAILQSVGKQCTTLGASPTLSQGGTMGSIPGWKAQAVTAADAINNLWLTICDIRSAVIALKDCCGSVDCSSFILGFSAAANEARTSVTLYFLGTTVVPSGFDNCTLAGSRVTFSDSAGHTYVTNVDLVAAAADADGIAFDLSSTTLNTALPYTVTIEGCLSKDGTICSKTATQNVSVPCPIVTGVTATLT